MMILGLDGALATWAFAANVAHAARAIPAAQPVCRSLLQPCGHARLVSNMLRTSQVLALLPSLRRQELAQQPSLLGSIAWCKLRYFLGQRCAAVCSEV